MKLGSPCIQWCLLAMLIDATLAERRIDDEKQYWQHQDIQKALENTDKKSWMYYRTLRNSERSKNTCVYAEVQGKVENEDVYKFVQEYIDGSGKKVKQDLFAVPYKTENSLGEERQKANAMRVKKNKDGPNGKEYQLIYSDYTCCDILRVLQEENGAACELYLHDKCVSKSVPEPCASIYGHACGRDNSFKNKVYNQSCRNTTEDTTKPSTKAPDHEVTPPEPPTEAPETPEETTTTSTLPPGC